MRLRPRGPELLRDAAEVVREKLRSHVDAKERSDLAAIEQMMARYAERLERDEAASAEDLAALERARIDLRAKVLAALPERLQYDARLVAKAVAIAANEWSNGTAFERAELERAAELLGDPVPTGLDAAQLRCTLADVNARLCAGIRAGDFDTGTPPIAAFEAHLDLSTAEALAETNPGYIRARSRATGTGAAHA